MIPRLVFAICAVACGRGSHPRNPDAIPTTTGTIEVDGELGEPDWSRRALRHVFTAPNGDRARPFSEVRLLHDEQNLYVGLYAADENIQSSDFFDVKIGDTAFRINPGARIMPAIAGCHAGVDLDGSLDDNSNDDEEWVLEIAMPLASVASVASGQAHVSRCDIPKDGIQRCGAWSGSLSLE